MKKNCTNLIENLSNEGTNVNEDGFWISNFSFSNLCLFSLFVSFLFCLKVREHEKLEIKIKN